MSSTDDSTTESMMAHHLPIAGEMRPCSVCGRMYQAAHMTGIESTWICGRCLLATAAYIKASGLILGCCRRLLTRILHHPTTQWTGDEVQSLITSIDELIGKEKA